VDPVTWDPAATTVLKRVLLGPPIPTRRLAQTLLPKILALPVFSSDALSSVAYATEQILIVLLAANAAAAGLVLPIAAAVAALMGIVVVSYRQTVRGYPHGGGAYIVARRNLGTIPGLVAAAALLTDYVLTVTVSVAAGAFAVTSAIPGTGSLRVELSLGFVALMTVANLRGLRESGIVFAGPTYAFIAAILTMSVVGLIRCVGGCPTAIVPSPIGPGMGAVGLFVILHAFSSGSTALTGVEAISNGVPAFRPPNARNAETVLATMGAIAITMFLSISWLAVNTGARPSHQMSVVAQIARAVFGPGAGFYAVQVTTAAILIVAANTAFQDFPRLSSILARDRFMPRPFQNRGDRLVFSNGIIVLALFASALVVAFDADVSRLIQLYVVGVFIAFTLSQSGMVVHWRRSVDPGRRRRMAINAIGAVATGLVLVVITVTKFVDGAWIVVVAVPIFVAAFLDTRRRIESKRARLTRGTVEVGRTGRDRCVLLVGDVGPPAASAWRYLHALGPEGLEALYIGSDEGEDAKRRWQAAVAAEDPLQAAEDRSPARLAARLNTLVEPQRFLIVAVPGLHRERRRSLGVNVIARLRHSLSGDVHVVFTQTPVVAGPPEAVPRRVVAVVLAAEAADPEARALTYARSVGAAEIRALHVALDPEGEQENIRDEWARRGFDPPLEVVDAPLRHLGPPLIDEARRVTAAADTLLNLVVPVVVGARLGGPFGHRHARYIEGLFLHTRRVMVSEVPFLLPDADRA
jgi:amino acid transporter